MDADALGSAAPGAQGAAAGSLPGTAVTDSASVLGTWTLDAVTMVDVTGRSTATKSSGVYAWRFRKDGSYVTQMTGFSLDLGAGSFDGCSYYAGGHYIVSNGQMTFGSRGVMPTAGTCPGAENGYFQAVADLGYGARLDAGDLVLVQNVGNGSSRLFHFKQTGKETWDGSGLDSELIGDWNLTGGFITYICGDAAPQVQRIDPSGLTVKISTDHIVETLSGFQALSTDDACSGKEVLSYSTDVDLEIQASAENSPSDCVSNYAPFVDGTLTIAAGVDGTAVTSQAYSSGSCSSAGNQTDTYYLAIYQVSQ
jgi:hypothetical protein